jgi:hypothetical protein
LVSAELRARRRSSPRPSTSLGRALDAERIGDHLTQHLVAAADAEDRHGRAGGGARMSMSQPSCASVKIGARRLAAGEDDQVGVGQRIAGFDDLDHFDARLGRSGSRSSKLAMRGRRGTAMTNGPPSAPLLPAPATSSAGSRRGPANQRHRAEARHAGALGDGRLPSRRAPDRPGTC